MTSTMSTANTVGQDALALVQKNYPNLAWMLNLPDLAPQIIQWAQSGADPSVVQAEFESSAWYQSHSDAARKWIAEMATDPAQAQADLQAQESAVSASLQALGVNPNSDQVAMFANASLMNGWTEQQLKDQITQSIQIGSDGTITLKPLGAGISQGTAGDYAQKLPNANGAELIGTVGPNGYQGQQIGGGAPVYAQMADGSLVQGFDMAKLPPGTKIYTLASFAPSASGANNTHPGGAGDLQGYMDQIQAEAGNYMVPLSQQTVSQFAAAMAQGTMDKAGVDAYLQSQATSLYPTMGAAIAAGITPKAYMDPYRTVAANLLSVSPDSIDMMNPKWLRPVTQKDPKTGLPTAMSLYDWQQTLMSDPTYGYMKSQNAVDRASSLAQGIAQMFGKTPGGGSGFSAAAAPRV